MAQEQRPNDPWARFGSAYDEHFTEANHAVATEALTRSGLASGMSLIDIAAGAGALSIPAARMGAEVLATDVSPTMLGLLEQRARAEGLANIRTQVMDGTALDLGTQRFDRVCSQLGVMFFMQAGLPEMYRVTAPGGRAVVVTFGHPDRVPLTMYDLAFERVLGSDSVPTTGNREPLTPDRLAGAMRGVGFEDVETHVYVQQLAVSSAEFMWQWIFASPAYAGRLDGLDEERLEALRSELLAIVHERYGDRFDSVAFELYIAIGRRD